MMWDEPMPHSLAPIPDAPFMPVWVSENRAGLSSFGSAPITPAKPKLTNAIRVRAQQQPRYRRRMYLETNLALAKAICSGDV